jgi:hypothetical protein
VGVGCVMQLFFSLGLLFPTYDKTMDVTESKTPSFIVLVQEQLNSLILSSEIQVKESGDFTSDTFAFKYIKATQSMS